MDTTYQIWIGLAEVVAVEGCRPLADARGAFVNVVTWANSEAGFHSKVSKMAAELQLQLVDLEDCEPFSKRRAEWEVDETILDMVDRVNEEPEVVAFGTFHMWHESDA
jgi:hypothetical protein